MDTEIRQGMTLFVTLIAAVACTAASPTVSSGADRCFGKKVDRVIGAAQGSPNIKAGDVVWLRAGAQVKAKAFMRICAGAGKQMVRAGKGRAWVSTGSGTDRIWLHKSSAHNTALAGAGDDRVFGSKGKDTMVGGAGADIIWGGGGNDRITDRAGIGNRLFGEDGSDQIRSLGTAVSELHGGNGSDFMYSNGGLAPSGAMEKLFGEKGNDRLLADRPDNLGPAYLDGGEGDDWMNGTPRGDVAIFNSGIKKIQMGEGDDLMIGSGRGRITIDAGPGRDTLSFEALVPGLNPFFAQGITVNLGEGYARGHNEYAIAGVEDVIGSAFQDEITGVPGQRNMISGGLGNDLLEGDRTLMEPGQFPTRFVGDPALGDIADGGLGRNGCWFFYATSNCMEDSPGDTRDETVVSIEAGGVLTVLGSTKADDIKVRYERAKDRYRVTTAGGAIAAGRCSADDAGGGSINCPADENRLNGIFVFGNDGDDRIELGRSVPATVTSTLDGGFGRNVIRGGPSKDFISTLPGRPLNNEPLHDGPWPGSAGSVLGGGGNLDMIYANDRVTVHGGPGPDGLRVLDPCFGAELHGGDDADSVVFAGAAEAVKADLAGGYARWRKLECSTPTGIAGDVEKLEGSFHDDWLIIGKRLPDQQGKSTLLGREGVNVLDAKNGDRNTVTTGPEKRLNKVKVDPQDKVIWGWGLAAF